MVFHVKKDKRKQSSFSRAKALKYVIL